MKTVMIFEIEQELYDQVTAVLNPLGYTLESAIVLFMEACVACNGIPSSMHHHEKHLAIGKLPSAFPFI